MSVRRELDLIEGAMRSTFFVFIMISRPWFVVSFSFSGLEFAACQTLVVLYLCFAFVLCGLEIGRDWRRMSLTIFMLWYALVDSFVFLCRF